MNIYSNYKLYLTRALAWGMFGAAMGVAGAAGVRAREQGAQRSDWRSDRRSTRRLGVSLGELQHQLGTVVSTWSACSWSARGSGWPSARSKSSGARLGYW